MHFVYYFVTYINMLSRQTYKERLHLHIREPFSIVYQVNKRLLLFVDYAKYIFQSHEDVSTKAGSTSRHKFTL